MSALKRVAALASVLALAPHSRAAEPTNRGFGLGPLRLRPSLELKNAGVETNVFNTHTDPVRDTVFVLTPFLDSRADLFGRRLQLASRGWLDFNHFSASGSESSTDASGEAGATVRVGLATLRLQGGRARLRQRISLELDQRLRRQESWQSLTLELALTNKLSLRGEVGDQAYRFERGIVFGENEVSASLDRVERRASLRTHYSLTDQTRLVLSSDTTEYHFAQALADARPLDRSHRLLGGLELGERAVVNGRLMLGLRSFPVAVAAGAAHYTGPTYAVSASMPIAGLARLGVVAERDLELAVELARLERGNLRTTFVHHRYRLSGDFSLPLSLIGEAFAGIESIRFLLPTQQGPLELRRGDRLYVGGGRLLRRFSSQFRLGVGVSWARRISNIPNFSYEGMRYGVQGEFRPY